LCFNPSDPTQLVTASRDKSIIIWDTRSGDIIQKITTPSENIHVTWKPDGSQIATASHDDIVSFVDPKNFKTLKTKQFQVEVNELKWDLSEKHFFVTTGQGSVEVLEFERFFNN
jgi:THO complex subunit 3